MITLRGLEESLHREYPALHWHCHPVHPTSLVPGSQIPQDIEISATREGGVPWGGPWHLSGSLLLLWGHESTARIVCKELAKPTKGAARSDASWDKLAEI
jgi:hypothetical protein